MTTSGGVASGGRPESTAEERKRAASGLIRSHDRVFRRTARRYSICADDAEDAYQRALEILLTKAPSIDGDALVRWMQTVTKREALAVRRQRERLLSAPRPSADEEDRDPLDSIASERPGPNDRAIRRERVARSGEALRALKPQEIRALTLKAEGYSYEEIGAITGWTYTKINRCMAEGRKRFLEVFSDIEQGNRCSEHAAALSALADGEAAVGAAEVLQLHLRSCGECRAKLRAFRGVPDRVLELMPIGPAVDQSAGGAAHEWIAERVGATADKVREVGYSVMSRGAGDGAGHVASSGGTRGGGMAAVGKVLAVCGATAAGSASCVATGVVDPGAIGIGGGSDKAAAERPADPVEDPAGTQVVEPAVPTVSDPPSTPDPAPEPAPARQAQRDFGFEKTAPTATGGGGGEFSAPTGGSGGSSGGGGSGGGGFGFEK